MSNKPVDRTVTLRTAEKLLRVGKLTAAIAEYTKLVRGAPKDWDTAILLAGLHVRTGNHDAAVDQYRATAMAMMAAEDFPRAGSVYEKVLALKPSDEDTIEQLATVCARTGDTAGACAHLTRVADWRMARGDINGAIDAFEEAAHLQGEGSDIAKRVFELCLQAGDPQRARAHAKSARDCRALAVALQQAGLEDDARDLLKDIARRDPSDLAAAALLAAIFVREGDAAAAGEYLTPALVGGDPEARLAAVELLMRGGRSGAAREMASLLLSGSTAAAERIADLATAAAGQAPDDALALLDLAVTRWAEERQWEIAATALEEFCDATPDYTASLVRLIEIGVDGDLDATVTRAQEKLVDAYLAHGSVAEGLAIAQDLAERDPKNPGYAAQLERARMMSSAGVQAAVARAS